MRPTLVTFAAFLVLALGWTSIAVAQRAGLEGPERAKAPKDAVPRSPSDSGNTCSKGLYAVDSPTAGDARVVDLQGRFKAVIRAEKKADGTIDVRCSHSGPATGGGLQDR